MSLAHLAESLNADYAAGASLRQLAATHGVSVKTAHKYVQSTRSAGNRRHHTIDESVFDHVTEEMAYWVGFLMADGCVLDSYRGQKVISVAAQMSDRGHHEKFKKFMKASYPITTKDNGTGVQFKFPSDHVAAVLASYGVVPRKSTREKCVGLTDNRHFWRGVFDGDGCFSFQREKGYCYRTAKLCGSKILCEQFSAFINTRTGVQMPSVKKYKNANCFAVGGCGNSYAPIARILYANSTVYLARKKKLAVEWLRALEVV